MAANLITMIHIRTLLPAIIIEIKAGVYNHIHILRDFNDDFPDSGVHGANMGPIWGRQDPGGPHVGPMNFAIWVN